MTWPDFMGKVRVSDPSCAKAAAQVVREREDLGSTVPPGKPHLLLLCSLQIDPEPTFVPTDLWALTQERGFTDTDMIFTKLPRNQAIIERLRPIKAQYDNGIQYIMRRFRVKEAELVAGTAVQTKHRKSSKELGHMVVGYCSAVSAKGTRSHCRTTTRSRSSWHARQPRSSPRLSPPRLGLTACRLSLTTLTSCASAPARFGVGKEGSTC